MGARRRSHVFRLNPQSAGFGHEALSARGSAGKGVDHLLHCSANLSRVGFRSADDRRADTAEDELVRASLHDVENHPAIGVVAHVGARARRVPDHHAVGAVAVRPRLERNQHRNLSR
jgi:hypothetical protein